MGITYLDKSFPISRGRFIVRELFTLLFMAYYIVPLPIINVLFLEHWKM